MKKYLAIICAFVLLFCSCSCKFSKNQTLNDDYIENYIKENSEAIYNDTAKLISFKSTCNNYESDVLPALDFVLSVANNMGMRTGKTSDGKVGWAEIGEGDNTLGIIGHVDIVDIGNIDNWKFDPFTFTNDSGYYYGRGIVDDKGPVILNLYAMKAILDSNCKLKSKIRLIIGTTEETDFSDMENYCLEYGAPTYSYTPDGDFPIYIMGNGYGDFILSFDESSNMCIDDISGGDSANTVPALATITINNKKETFTGKAAHSSTPEFGSNAIIKLGLYAAEKGYNFGRFIKEICIDNNSSPLCIDTEQNIYNGVATTKSIFIPTLIWKENNTVKINFNLRLNPLSSKDILCNSLDSIKDNYNFTYNISAFDKPFICKNCDQQFIKVMKETYESFGYEGKYLCELGASYASIVPNTVLWGPVLEGDESCAHMENERMKIDSFFKVFKIYLTYIAKISL